MKVLLKTYAEILENGWKKEEVIITEREIIIGKNKKSIDLKSIVDVEKTIIDNKKVIEIKYEKSSIKICFPENLVDRIFKFLVFNFKDKFAIYFLYPATVGGVIVKDSKWEKGYLCITENAIWFLSPKRQIKIRLDSIGNVDMDVRTIGNKEWKVLVIGHVKNSVVITGYVLCPETTLQLIKDYLNRLLEKTKPKVELSEKEKEILMMVYSGLSSVEIENMLGISTEELNKYFDKFVELGLAEVVKIRKEIQLTPRGFALVNELMRR